MIANATLARWVGEDIQTMLNHGRLHSYLAEPPVNAAPYDIKEGGGVRQVGEIRMKGPGGKIFLASINQGVVHEADGRVRTRGVVHDLTVERAMRQALEASEVRFRRFFEEAPLGILIIGNDMVVEDCNDVLANMLGRKTEEVEGQSFFQTGG